MARPDPDSAEWLELATDALPVADALQWSVAPQCGAVVVFCGTVRDHAEGRPGVVSLHYEAYEEEVGSRLAAIAADVRRRWPDVGRLAILHRVGELAVTEVSVVVTASAPHRAEAFAAARFAIDAVKTTVPIWKRERWMGGEDWATCDHPVTDLTAGALAAADA